MTRSIVPWERPVISASLQTTASGSAGYDDSSSTTSSGFSTIRSSSISLAMMYSKSQDRSITITRASGMSMRISRRHLLLIWGGQTTRVLRMCEPASWMASRVT